MNLEVQISHIMPGAGFEPADGLTDKILSIAITELKTLLTQRALAPFSETVFRYHSL